MTTGVVATQFICTSKPCVKPLTLRMLTASQAPPAADGFNAEGVTFTTLVSPVVSVVVK
jgi:hypothetical protein